MNDQAQTSEPIPAYRQPWQTVTVTLISVTLALSQILHVFNMRTRGGSPFVNDVTRNPYIWGALTLCGGLMVGAIYLPGISFVLGLSDPGTAGWSLIIGMTGLQFIAAQGLGKAG